MIRCIFFDNEITARKCLETQLLGKAICKTCKDGKTIKEMLQKIKDSGNKEEVMPRGETVASKTCIDCKRAYKPTSNVQKWCPECKKNHKTAKRENKSQVSLNRKNKAVSSAKSAAEGGSVAEPENKTHPLIPSREGTFNSPLKRGAQGCVEVEIKRNNSKIVALAQLLYASDLLDSQLNNAIENGIIDTKIILDIRFRLGAILRTNTGIPPAEART